MEKIFKAFNDSFSYWKVTLSPKVKKSLYPGEILKQGWHIRYIFGSDERGRYMDYYASHRMTNDSHVRIYETGEQEDLPAVQELMFFSADATEKEREELEDQFHEQNRKVYGEISRKYCGVTGAEFDALVTRCRNLPPAKGNYLINDYVENLLLTVLDFRLHTTTVERAMRYYLKHSHGAIRTFQDLKHLLNSYPDTREGNQQVAQYLWGYSLWNRIELLRRLLQYFEVCGVKSQDELKSWAEARDFKEVQGRIKGIGFAIYKWLVMRLGVEAIKPDIWVHRFVQDTIGRKLSDEVAAVALQLIAKELDKKAYELDWSIWEYQRSLKQSG